MGSAAAALHGLILQCRCLPELRQAHAQAALLGLLRSDLPVSSALILSYASLHDLLSARRLFALSPLRHRGAFLWNALSRALAASGLNSDAFALYNLMLRSGVRPDDRTFPFSIAAAVGARASQKGRELHGSVFKFGFEADVFVGNTLVSFYGSCCDFSSARRVFDEMPHRDIVSWNSIISVFCDNGMFLDSMKWFLKLIRIGLPVNSVSLVSVIPACAALQDEVLGMVFHVMAIKTGLDSSINLGNAFIDMYGKFEDLESSMQLFRSMPVRNEVSWNSIIGSLVHVKLHEDALLMFRDMLEHNISPSSVSISVVLPALVELGHFDLGKEVHGYSMRLNLDCDVYVANSLVDMYAKFGLLGKGSHVFERIESHNVVSWNVMISNLALNGDEMEAFWLVREMQRKGECPNDITLVNILSACSRRAFLKKGVEIHARSIRMGSITDLFISNALIDMYAKCGQLNLARNIFDRSKRDDVSYNTLIMGYSESPWSLEALHLFREMSHVGLEYDAVSFMGILSACANSSALKQGKEVHCLLIRNLLSDHLFVANSLLDFYTKGGKLDTAMRIFHRMSKKDVASWNALILGYGMHGELETAFKLFDLMKDHGVEYDHVSYIAVLSACSHRGLVQSGKKYFAQMLTQNIRPRQMHYSCMVDLLGRAGLLTEAEKIIREMPFEADSDVWGALLGACRIHGNIDLARCAAEHLFQLKPEHSGYYLLLSNMYAEAGRWDEANEIRRLMKSRKVKKNPGYSWVESGNKLLAFVVGERGDDPKAGVWYAEAS